MPAPYKGTVKYNLQIHPATIDALRDAAPLTGHATGNLLATDLLQFALDYLIGGKDEIPPALQVMRASITDPRAPQAFALRPTNVAARLATHTREIAEIKALLQKVLGKPLPKAEKARLIKRLARIL